MSLVLMMLSREVRRVPMDYEHPKRERYDYRTLTYVQDFQPVFDRFYVPAVREWLSEWESWQKGEHPAQQQEDSSTCSYEEWDGNGPDPDYYYPGSEWPDDAEMGIRMYESVSEGTPISATYPDTDEGRRKMAEELATRDSGITSDMTVADWLRVIDGQVLAKDVHTGEIR